MLCTAVADDDADAAKRMVSAVHMLGAFLPVDTWLELALDCVTGRASTPSQKASALVVLSGLLHSSSRVQGAFKKLWTVQIVKDEKLICVTFIVSLMKNVVMTCGCL